MNAEEKIAIDLALVILIFVLVWPRVCDPLRLRSRRGFLRRHQKNRREAFPPGEFLGLLPGACG
jgi:hypothetical protein